MNGAAGKKSELRQRIITAVLLAAGALVAVAAGGWVFGLFVAAGAFIVFREWTAMTPLSAFPNREWVANGLMALALGAVLILPGPLAALCVVICAGAAYTLLDRFHRETAAWVAVAILYCAFGLFCLARLRAYDDGVLTILLLFAMVWGTDIGAYFVGRRIGGPKLAPSISPGKTQSGALGGLLAAVLGVLLVAALAGQGNLLALAAIAILVSIVAQAGDLFESFIKRRFNVKDSGRILPGHGGLFDRVDGLIPAAIAFFIITQVTG
jgi:phosphatidate cytidylyltransferase